MTKFSPPGRYTGVDLNTLFGDRAQAAPSVEEYERLLKNEEEDE